MNLNELYAAFLSSSAVSTDSRNIEKDCIFFALKGDNFNGNLYAKSAIDKGAKYVVIDEEVNDLLAERHFLVKDVLSSLQDLAKHHREILKTPIIGITGSNGKTTTKELLAAVLSKKFHLYYTAGNLNNHIGVPLSLLAIKKEHELAIIEMGANHQEEIAFLSKIAAPNFGLITNIGKAHLEGFGGVEGIKKGKGELFDYIKQSEGKLFLNADSDVLQEMAKARGLKAVTYGKNAQANLEGSLESSNPFISFIWNWSYDGVTTKSNEPITSQLFGSYNYDNLLAAVCVGNYFGVDENDINDAVSSYQSDMNRSQIIEKGNNTIYLDAYNANPTSMNAALESFAQLNSTKEKALILGDMFELGEAGFEEHQSILELVVSLKLTNGIFVGKHFSKHSKKYPAYKFFEERQHLVDSSELKSINNSAILIKGSRGVALEKLLEFIS
jgi:UDP-N-acetylmuramoyl-tripeptide--D-alanyl-D-alanine ligase